MAVHLAFPAVHSHTRVLWIAIVLNLPCGILIWIPSNMSTLRFKRASVSLCFHEWYPSGSA